MNPKLTPWIPGTGVPVRDGWYLRRMPNGEPVRSYFESPQWYAGKDAFFPSPDQDLPWRGLASDPYAKGKA